MTSESVVLITLPKSGSVYIHETLRESYDLQPIEISSGLFMTDRVHLGNLNRLATGGYISQSHLPADWINVQMLNHFVDRWVVHVRDPRQATLSYVHHLNKQHRENPWMVLMVDSRNPLDASFFNSSLEEQISWMIQFHLRAIVSWIEGWNSSGYRSRRFMFTTYEDLNQRPLVFFRKLLKFYGLPAKGFKYLKPEVGALHYRNGQIDEWRSVFTDEQKEKAWQSIPDWMAERFGWEP